jgi:hypothetical protein
MVASKRSFTAGHFHLLLDGSNEFGFVKSAEGGFVKGNVVTEQIGPDQHTFKHISTLEIEPISMQIGMAMTASVFDWVKASWDKEYARKNGVVVHTDFNGVPMYEQEFTDALIAETTFPALDASDNTPAYLTVKIHPEKLTLKKSDGKRYKPVIPEKQKLWSPANFMLDIKGIDCSHVHKIDSFSVKQKIKPLYFGAQRHPQLEPVGIEYDNITLYTSLAHADEFIEWHKQYIMDGGRDIDFEKEGFIEFYPPDMKGEPLLRVDLERLGLFSLSIDKSEANADAVKRVKIELYVESMKLGKGWGLA